MHLGSNGAAVDDADDFPFDVSASRRLVGLTGRSTSRSAHWLVSVSAVRGRAIGQADRQAGRRATTTMTPQQQQQQQQQQPQQTCGLLYF